MSNEEEKRCPLCAEEMDWTDQQFMPCKCGYQVCVWCWHHIIDMAEKDGTEGRCPACRTVYEKEKIIAKQTNCERTMSKISNKKSKPPKAKPKANEVKKDLTNVRVIQRKMAYVIGLPLSLADEDVLLRKEYFGQYGKVTKVSLSRTAGGAVQHFINDTCSVYITYSKEEEALRCIQSVHGFVLEDRFLRASFGTAKYCHAWLKNMPCNNPACLYLHSLGADEDSFGKDEVAAVHTRSRVQQIVGATNSAANRSGNVLPPPADDFCNSSSTYTDKSIVRNGISDSAHDYVNSSSDVHPCKEKEGPIAVPHKMTTFVDIVGRSNSSVSEKEGNIPEDRNILNLCSEFSSSMVSRDTHTEVPYYVPSQFSVSSNRFLNGLFKSSQDEPLEEGGLALLQKKTHSMNDFAVDNDPVHNRDDEVSLPIRCVSSVSNDSCQEVKFQYSAKSDRVYRSSKSFSNEEIVEHLRRIGGDNLTNDEENSVLDAVESSIISNIMSIDFDSCEDSLTMPNGLSELLDDAEGLGGSSWSSLNSDQSEYSFVKQQGFVSQMAASILPQYGDNKDQYFSRPQYPVARTQTLAPPGFSMPSRDPPPGFSTADRTGLPRPPSGNRLANGSPFSSFQPSSGRHSGSIDDADFFDPASLLGSQTNGNTRRPTAPPGLSAYTDESRLWLLMQQSAPAHQDSNFSHFYSPKMPSTHWELSYTDSPLDSSVYGLSSRLVEEHQNSNPSSYFTQMPEQKYANGYLRSLDEGQVKGEGGMTEVQRNERLGVDYFPGYGDLMFSSGGDVYTRVFGL